MIMGNLDISCPYKFYWMSAVIGTIFCLSPLFFLGHRKFDTDIMDPHSVLPITFLVVIIPAADLMLDFPSHFMSHFYPNKKSARKYEGNSVVIRLTDIERLLFIFGVAIQSVIYFIPSSTSISTISIVNSCVNNCNVLLTIVPISIFLQRCTTAFTHLRTTVLLATLEIGLMFYTISFYYPRGSSMNLTISTIGNVFVTVSALIYVLIVFSCAVSYCRQKTGTSRHWILELMNLSTVNIDVDVVDIVDNDNELYTNYVPALHMLSIILIATANFYVKLSPQDTIAAAYEHRIYITLVAEVLVLVLELRIRKNEVARGLVRLSKHLM